MFGMSDRVTPFIRQIIHFFRKIGPWSYVPPANDDAPLRRHDSRTTCPKTMVLRTRQNLNMGDVLANRDAPLHWTPFRGVNSSIGMKIRGDARSAYRRVGAIPLDRFP